MGILRFWFALFGPKRLPDAVRAKLKSVAAKVMADLPVREQLANLDIRPKFAPAAVPRTKLESEISTWTKFIDEKGIKPE